MDREKGIVRASIVGIAANLLLVAFKLLVGLLANSIAIILDAVNNASDALSSIITIIGTKLAGRRPDRKHPFGYGRIEYITSMVIAVIILAAGVVSARESILKIIDPAETDYSDLTIIVVVAAILAKVFIGIYLGRAGKTYDSQALRASAVDSNYDAVISGGTLVAALVAMFWNINIDGIVGLAISIFVIKAGIDILREALDPIIGQRESDKFGHDLKEYVCTFDGVLDTHDLILDNFGPHQLIGSIHIDVADDMLAREINDLSRRIAEGVYRKFNVVLTVGIYTVNDSPEAKAIRKQLIQITDKFPQILEVHGFYVDEQRKKMDFDLVIDFHSDAQTIKESVVAAMTQVYPDYTFDVVVDTDYID